MTESEIMARLTGHFGAKVLKTYEHRGQCAVTVAPEHLRAVVTYLRDEADLAFDMLMDVAGVDYLGYPDSDDLEWRFEVAYQFYSLSRNHRIRVKVAVRDESVKVPSVWDLYNIANWMEREVYDLFGVVFSGHPNLRRIMCHDEFVGHALRKDYPINRRQKLSQPSENILCEKSEYA
jgi:NADH/F420H2 dehydrogenase subunit C